jgi:hypothetical protein
MRISILMVFRRWSVDLFLERLARILFRRRYVFGVDDEDKENDEGLVVGGGFRSEREVLRKIQEDRVVEEPGSYVDEEEAKAAFWRN